MVSDEISHELTVVLVHHHAQIAWLSIDHKALEQNMIFVDFAQSPPPGVIPSSYSQMYHRLA